MALVPGTGSGDPHFKTFTGQKYDYHGECDLVLIDNPSFADGLGMRLHIRTTRVKYWSYIEQIALQIGDDVLEFDNDVDNFLINGAKVGEAVRGTKTRFGLEEFWLRRDPKALSLRLDNKLKAKIDFIQHKKTHFPAVSVNAGSNQTIFEGSLGMLGQWGTGKMMGRDGVTEFDDAEAFALEWQVRSDEPMLFSQARFPQHPQKCTPPKAMPLMNRLGSSHMRKEAERPAAAGKKTWKIASLMLLPLVTLELPVMMPRPSTMRKLKRKNGLFMEVLSKFLACGCSAFHLALEDRLTYPLVEASQFV